MVGRPSRWLASLCVICLGCGDDGPLSHTPPPDPPPTQPGWKSFSITGIQTERAARNVGFYEFLTEPSLRMGIYHLAAGSVDGQGAHGEDEIYYVAGGKAQLQAAGVDYPAETGTAFFVRAGVDHGFHSIEADLDVLVIFAAGTSSPSSPAVLSFPPNEAVSARDGSANVWDPLLNAGTLTLGMYMLPASVGGDDVLTHPMDEINIVVAGRARLTVGTDTIDIEPGSLVYVERGEGHSFGGLEEDVDVLILWSG